MAGFRGDRQYTEGPSAWQRRQEFAKTKWYENFWPGQLKTLLKPLGLENEAVSKGDNRGIIVATESEIHDEADHVFGYLKDMLALKDTGPWRYGPPPFLYRFVKEFYKENGDELGWIVFEGGRDPIAQRHKAYKELLVPSTTPDFALKAKELRKRETIPLYGGMGLSTLGLGMVLPDGLTIKDAFLTSMTVHRTLGVESSRLPLIGDWISWCLASPDGDHDTLSKGSAPASGQHLLVGSINPAKMIVFTKFNHTTDKTYSYTFDLHPASGHVFSIRRASLKLRMQIALDPWLDDWLLSALRDF